MMRFERFTQAAQDTAARAYEILQRYGHNQVDTEHILLALLEQTDGVIPELLRGLGADVDAMRARLGEILQASPKRAVYGQAATQVFITPRVKRIIDLANEEANRLRDEYISTAHLFLAVLAERNTAVAKVLADSGITREKVYDIVKELGPKRGDRAASSGSLIPLRHDRLTAYLRQLLDSYFALNPIGTVVSAPFTMDVGSTGILYSPDLQVILHTNSGKLTEAAMLGPADICVEVVSNETLTRDYGEKFAAYEDAGVAEYWTMDPLRQECRFHHLQPTGVYLTHPPDADGSYSTPILPQFALQVPTLWLETLPNIVSIVQSAQEMLK